MENHRIQIKKRELRERPSFAGEQEWNASGAVLTRLPATGQKANAGNGRVELSPRGATAARRSTVEQPLRIVSLGSLPMAGRWLQSLMLATLAIGGCAFGQPMSLKGLLR